MSSYSQVFLTTFTQHDLTIHRYRKLVGYISHKTLQTIKKKGKEKLNFKLSVYSLTKSKHTERELKMFAANF